MVQLKILSGKSAGVVWSARRFPVRIGRAAACDLQLEEEGVWDQHLRLELSPGEGFILNTETDALASINGQTTQQTLLRNGDTIEFGAVRLQFWLSEARQSNPRFREALTWTGIASLCLAQIALIYWLLNKA
jgi:hypothetical protein